MFTARLARRVGLAALVVFAAIQLVPYGWAHPNPRVVQDAPWPNRRAESIARVSCYPCHSNETDWPAYSYVAPMSWLVRYDVERGRDEFNFSNWPEYGEDVDDAVDEVEDGDMPLDRYTVIHRDAKLTPEEARVLARALLSMSPPDD
jgi:hypothetical protein